jgi:hypothetical protein
MKKSFKNTFLYQLLFVPKKGQLLTVVAWVILIGGATLILNECFNWW